MKIIVNFLSLFLLINFTSCNKSPKSLLTDGSRRFLQKRSGSEERNQELRFADYQTISFGNDNVYKGTWIDDYTFRFSVDGDGIILKFSEHNNESVAILYENEKLPIKQEDWLKLESNDRVLGLFKNDESTKDVEFYLIDGKQIPLKYIPTAGVYLTKNWSGNISGGVKVEIDNENVVFYTATDGNLNWRYAHIESYDEDGTFLLKDFLMHGSYNGKDELHFNNGAMGVSESDSYDVYILQSINNQSLIGEYISKAIDYGLIFNGEEQNGTIVKKQYKGKYLHYDTPVEALDIPEGKMWTMLYCEVSDESTHGKIKVYPQNRGGSWSRKSGFYFDVMKSDFVSIKYSKQQHSPLVANTNPAIMYIDNPGATCIIYYYEESIY